MLKKKSDICLVNCWRHRNPFIKWVIFHLSSGINSDKIPGWLPKVGNNKESRISWQDVAIWPRLLVCRLARKTLIYGTKKTPSHSEPENKNKSRVTDNFLPEALKKSNLTEEIHSIMAGILSRELCQAPICVSAFIQLAGVVG